MTQDEQSFFQRVALTMKQDALGIEDAMRAVLKRDEELFLLATTDPAQWTVIVHEMAADLYQAFQA